MKIIQSYENMNHLFIIQAHNQLPLLRNLVETLSAPNHYFLIHLDRKSKQLLCDSIMEEIQKLERVKIMCFKSINWGGANQILLTLDLLKMVDVKRYDFVHLLSGVDMPIRSNIQFDAFFDSTQYEGFLSFVPQTDAYRCEKERLGRYYLYDVLDPRSRMLLPRAVNGIVNLFQGFIEGIGFTIRQPMKLKVYKGANWFSASIDIVKYILDFCSKNEWYVKRFKWTSCCDEIFFHTIVMNSPYAEKVCHDDLRYIDWKQKIEGESLPRILDENDFEDIIKSDCLFCRKLDEEKSRTLINKIRSHRLSQK